VVQYKANSISDGTGGHAMTLGTGTDIVGARARCPEREGEKKHLSRKD
jgi:hypothetical protein